MHIEIILDNTVWVSDSWRIFFFKIGITDVCQGVVLFSLMVGPRKKKSDPPPREVLTEYIFPPLFLKLSTSKFL